MGIHRPLSSSAEITYRKAPCKYEDVNEWYFIRYYDRLYMERRSSSLGSKSTIHRFHLYLCEHDVKQIFNELLNKGYDLKKINLSHCFTDTKDIPAKKGEISATMVTRK
jgi:hypothetical protein